MALRPTGCVLRHVIPVALVFVMGGAGIAASGARPEGEQARRILEAAGVKGGLIVHLGCGDGRLTAALRPNDRYLVHGLHADAAGVAKARRHIRSLGLYGPVSVARFRGERLPYADNLVNLVVSENLGKVPMTEVMRVLCPNGVAYIKADGRWTKKAKPWPEGMDQWTHYLHGPDGNPVANDSIVGPPERLQWIGSPRWARHHDHMASMTSLVSSAGRLFYIFDEGLTASIQLPSRWRLIARDAFNGAVLWKRDIDQWNTRQYPLKSGPAHLLRRLVAVGDRVYCTLGIDAPVTVLDAATGRTLRTYEGSRFSREIVVSEGVAFLVADTGPSKLPDWRRKATYVWANTRLANPGWGWPGDKRRILAYEAQSGRLLWQAAFPVAPCSLAVDGPRVVFHDGEKLVCLDRRNGSPFWQGEPTPVKLPVHTNTGPRVLIRKDVVLFAGNNGKMSGWSIKDGKKLWEQKHKPSGHMSLQDLFVADGLTWTGAIASSQQDGVFTAYDPLTGKMEREFKPDVQVHWFHHRCYPAKATNKYLLTGRNGTEYIDTKTGHWKPHHWVRGGCIYGVMPCNGMTYASMDACGCQLEAKLDGFKALASGPVPRPDPADLSGEARLEKGPAYGQVRGPASASADWPTYRHDEGRSGAASTTVSPSLAVAWQVPLGGRLTPPTVAAGNLYVASIDTHTLHALDAGTGKPSWSFVAGGRIDSPPTYYRGLVLFGSADGYVYALRAADGVLAWRFRGAPLDRRMMAWEQLESTWPVHGSVLVHDGVVYCTAGRNMYLDGGIRFIRLDPATGRLLGEVVMGDTDPETGQDMHLAYLKKTRGNNMPVALSDVLSCDGRHIWMRSQKIDFKGNRLEIGLTDVYDQPSEDFHLFCQIGFLDDSYFFRSYWTYGRRVTGGYGGWFQAGRLVPAGRILCYDEDRIYGYGRKPAYMVNASVVEYQLFAADKKVTREAIEHVRKAGNRMNARSRQKNATSSDWRLRHFFPAEDLSAARFKWTMDQPAVITRAMAVAGDTLFVGGPPDLIDERRAYHLPDDPDVQAALTRQAEALEGRCGGQLWALAKAGGKVLARYALDTIPVFDGMAAAGGHLYVATLDGRVLCLAEKAASPLPRIGDQPVRIAWDQPEDPTYLLPVEEPREGDFAKVTRCKVTASKLGYRLRAKGKQQVGLALKKLDQPITGTATFKTHVKVVPGAGGLLRNGYLAFGDGADDRKLIKCGVRLRNQRAAIVQGPLLTGKSKGADVRAPDEKGLAISVTVDIKAGKVTYTANGVTIEARMDRPLKSITHVGYAMDSACIDVAPITIRTP
jgi:outer membrane protein assembly factor BamB